MQGDTCQITTNTSVFPIGHVSLCKARRIYIHALEQSMTVIKYQVKSCISNKH